MKLRVTQENLNKALSSVGRIASNRATLPILSNILLKTKDNRLSVSATNLDIAITHYIGAKITKEGSTTVPARLTHDFIASLPSGVIDLKLKDQKLSITTEKYKSTINGISAEDFPVMPAIEGGKTWSINAKKLKSGLQQTIFSASNDDSRPVLTGVYLHSYEGKLYVVATDSYRLAEKELVETNDEISLLIPANAMQELLRLIPDDEEEVEVVHDDQQVLFKLGDIELVTRQIDGNYPDYRKLIPKNFSVEAELKKPDFVNITKVSSLFARESAGSITINASEEDEVLNINSIASQLGENKASAEAKITGEGSVTLNSRYIIDALSAVEGDKVTFSFNGKLEPCVLKNPKVKDYLHVIMPLKS